MEDLPLGRIAGLMPEFAVKDLPLGRTLIYIYIGIFDLVKTLMELIFNLRGEFR